MEPLTIEDVRRYEADARRILADTPKDTDEGRGRRSFARELLNVSKAYRAILREPHPDPKRVALERRVRALEEKVKTNEIS